MLKYEIRLELLNISLASSYKIFFISLEFFLETQINKSVMSLGVPGSLDLNCKHYSLNY